MEWIQVINKAIIYMEEHLLEDIQVVDIAEYVHISLFHFQRSFNMLTGMTTAEYIRKRRLSLAGEELTKPGAKVIDVALKYGYDSPESFAKAFSRFHGITPRQAKNGNDLKSFNKFVIKLLIEGGTVMDYRVEKKEELKLIVYGRKFSVENCEEGIPKLWSEYFKNELYKQVPGYLGICAQEKEGAREFLYGIGCDVDDVLDIPNGFTVVDIPEYTWVIFKCTGPMPDAIQKMWDVIYKEWLPSTEYEIIQDYEIENYLPGDNTSADYVSEIWIPVKERA